MYIIHLHHIYLIRITYVIYAYKKNLSNLELWFFITIKYTIKYKQFRGGQKNQTEPNQNDSLESKINQSICLNHLVEDFINPNSPVRFGFKPNQKMKVYQLD